MQWGNDCFTYTSMLCGSVTNNSIFEKQPPPSMVQNFDVEFWKMIFPPSITNDSL